MLFLALSQITQYWSQQNHHSICLDRLHHQIWSQQPMIILVWSQIKHGCQLVQWNSQQIVLFQYLFPFHDPHSLSFHANWSWNHVLFLWFPFLWYSLNSCPSRLVQVQQTILYWNCHLFWWSVLDCLSCGDSINKTSII